MSGDTSFMLSDLLPHVCAILALLLLWQYHQIQVLTGRIQATDIFDRSGIRMYLFAVPDDDLICPSCRDALGLVCLPSKVAEDDFTPLKTPCIASAKCMIVMVGLYGGWLEARRVVEKVRAAKKEGSIQLTPTEFAGLLKGNWEGSLSAATDRLAVIMVKALTSEKTNPAAASTGYVQVIQEAQEVHDLPLVVPAYLRLTDVLTRQGHPEEAMQVIQEFENRYPRSKKGPYFPHETQRGLMAIKKNRLRTGASGTKPQATPPLSDTAQAV